MPHVWALIRAIESFSRTKDKRNMNAESVVNVILGDISDSDWNESDEERLEDSYTLDKLTMDQGKMADTRDSVIFTCIL